jgi:hypothetical protein
MEEVSFDSTLTRGGAAQTDGAVDVAAAGEEAGGTRSNETEVRAADATHSVSAAVEATPLDATATTRMEWLSLGARSSNTNTVDTPDRG